MELAEVTVETMKPLIGTSFDLVGHDVQLGLIAVDEHDTGDAPMESFALLFEGPSEPGLSQGNWTVAAGDRGFELFLVPIGPRSGGLLGYEAIVSRMTD